MVFTSGQVQADVSRKIHGALSSSFFDSLNEAARWLLTTVDPYETKRRTYLEDAIYQGVSTYYVPIDVKDQKIIDIRRQNNQNGQINVWTSFVNITNRTFNKYNTIGNGWGALGTYTIEPIDNIKYIKIKDWLPNTTLNVNMAESLTNNGTWNVYGSVNNLTVDQLNYLTGTGSLRFNIDTSTSGALECSGMQSANISSYMQIGALFTSVFLPTPNSLINVTLKWGSSSTDFYSFTVTAPHNSPTWVAGWNLLKFPLDGMNVFGNPDPSNITLLRFEFQTTGASMNNVHVENIVARKGTVYEILYYSSYLFSDSQSGDWKPQSYDLGDIINLSTTSYDLLMLKTAIIEAQEVKNSLSDVQVLSAELQNHLTNYLMDNKSEYIRNQEAWYKPIDPSRAQYYPFGGGGY